MLFSCAAGLKVPGKKPRRLFIPRICKALALQLLLQLTAVLECVTLKSFSHQYSYFHYLTALSILTQISSLLLDTFQFDALYHLLY